MLLFILKSSACLAIFMLFYKLCLEETSAHTFKRLYLIGILLASIGIPFITFTEYVEVQPINFITHQVFNSTSIEIPEIKSFEDYLPTILWSIYALGVIIFLFRFFKNLYQLFTKIKSNPKYKNQNYIHVLLHDLIHPHTFFNYIFLNKTKYEHNQIPREVLLHEQTHAKQKHAIDILFIEVLQIVFWFNPLLYLIKKDIKLNHEFLADRAVINTGYNTKNYQQLLLAFSSNAADNPLANAINYSLIKKRFTVMKTKTSKQTFWLRSFILLPMLALLIYSFSNKVTVEKELNLNEINVIQKNAKSILILINFKDEILINDDEKPCEINALKTKLKIYLNTLSELQKETLTVDFRADSECSKEAIMRVKTILRELGLFKVTFKQISTITATPEELIEYNKMAKHYNALPANKRIIDLLDLKRLETIYGVMTEEQKVSAEPFPNCPPPPPPPPMPAINTNQKMSEELLKTKKEFDKKGNEYGNAVSVYLKENKGNQTELKAMYIEVMELYNKYNNLAEKENLIPPPPPPPAPKVKKGAVSDIPPPPPPPEPKSP